ncbi:MAG: hypothetical protein Q9214_000538 [Letrouitia sp. 1 TL-2023]
MPRHFAVSPSGREKAVIHTSFDHINGSMRPDGTLFDDNPLPPHNHGAEKTVFEKGKRQKSIAQLHTSLTLLTMQLSYKWYWLGCLSWAAPSSPTSDTNLQDVATRTDAGYLRSPTHLLDPNAIRIQIPESKLDLNIYLLPESVPQGVYSSLYADIDARVRREIAQHTREGTVPRVLKYRDRKYGLQIKTNSRFQWFDIEDVMRGLHILENEHRPLRLFKYDIFQYITLVGEGFTTQFESEILWPKEASTAWEGVTGFAKENKTLSDY